MKFRNLVAGFTLIELSISLVIIGLIVGGILGARDLIRQAALHRVASEAQQYENTLKTFKLKYAALPGDMNNAYDYWGTNCAASAANCNGDKNGRIDYFQSTGDPKIAEMYTLWKHLELAGIIPGSYFGHSNQSALYPFQIGAVPSITGIDNGIFVIQWVAPDNVMQILNRIQSEGLFAPADAKAIDMKMDDGLGASGRIRALEHTADGDCSDGSWSGEYTLNTATQACELSYLL